MSLNNSKIIAIFCVILGTSLFATADVFVKFLGEGMTIFQIAFWVDIFALIAVLLFSRPLGGLKKTLNSSNKKLHLLRSAFITLGYFALLVSLINAPLAETYSLLFTAPILGIIWSFIFLKEKIKTYHAIALTLGFLGVLFVLNPGFSEFNPYLLFSFVTAVMFSFAMVVGRKNSPDRN